MTVMNSKAPPKKAKGVSKKTKKGWRKNVDITEVEAFLEDQRLEERLGGAFEQRSDQEIFVVDKTSGEDKRKTRSEKPLKCYQHLEITGGVADPKKGRNLRKTRMQRKNPTVVEQEKQLVKKGVVKAKVLLAKKHRAADQLKKASQKLERSTRRRTEFDFDLWSKTEDPLVPQEKKDIEANEWLTSTTKTHTLKNTGQKVKRPPRDFMKKPSDLSAVKLPHGGSSYNPSYKDHQDLLWKAAIVEINKEKAQKKIDYHTTLMFPDKKEAPTEQSWLAEMSEGIPALDETKEEEKSEDEEESEGDEEAKSFKAKTKKQRRKEKLVKREAKKRERMGKDKVMTRDLLYIKSLRKRVRKEEEEMKQKSEQKSAKRAADKALRPAQLSKHKYQEPDLELKLSDELSGNLRGLRPEGNLLEERYKSMQRRSLVEARPRFKEDSKKRNKRKRVEKRSYKMGFTWEK